MGKTTTAAALALQAAVQGSKALVLTIDPARRLANSLGLDGLSNEEKRVPAELLEKQGVKIKGELYAAMLDTKQSFDDLIRRITSSERSAQKILNNFVYKELSNALAGSQEYIAMERLYYIMEQGGYDLVVLDTPPTKNALDFLHAHQSYGVISGRKRDQMVPFARYRQKLGHWKRRFGAVQTRFGSRRQDVGVDRR